MESEKIDAGLSGILLEPPPELKKAPRKPRPSELAAKAAKAVRTGLANHAKHAPWGSTMAVSRKVVAKKAPKKAKPSAGKRLVKAAKQARAIARNAGKSAAVPRDARMDLRLTQKEKMRLLAKSAKLRRTITSMFMEFIEKL